MNKQKMTYQERLMMEALPPILPTGIGTTIPKKKYLKRKLKNKIASKSRKGVK